MIDAIDSNLAKVPVSPKYSEIILSAVLESLVRDSDPLLRVLQTIVSMTPVHPCADVAYRFLHGFEYRRGIRMLEASDLEFFQIHGDGLLWGRSRLDRIIRKITELGEFQSISTIHKMYD